MTAALPMYDLPGLRAETDALWSAIRDALRAAGFDAPDALIRPDDDPWPLWRDPALTFSQTCGLPYAARLAEEVTLLGAPDHGLPGAPAGFYYSEIVVRADDDAKGLGEVKGKRFAYNMRESQSGWAAVNMILDPREHFGELVETGAHLASAAAVREGRADVASLDAVTLALARDADPDAVAGLKVIHRTRPTPALPFITAKRPAAEATSMAAAVAAGIAAADSAVRGRLRVHGLAPLTPDRYAPLAAGWPLDAA